MSAARYVAVVLPVPVSRSYIYEVPDALAAAAVAGARVVVTLRGRRVIGVVLEESEKPPVAAAKVLAVPDPEPAVAPALLALARWMSDYYGAPLGLALRTVLPGALWSAKRPEGPAPGTERVLILERALPALLEREKAFRRAPRRRAAYETVEALGGAAPVPHLVGRLCVSRGAHDDLVRLGQARIDTTARPRDPFVGVATPPPEPTAEQSSVVAAIAATPVDLPVLLQGVTGSGKTLVYLEVLRRLVAAGQGAIVLVPEIALTPQTVARVRGVFGDQVAVLHSGLSDAERADAWRALRRGDRLVAVGARSAVFAPVQRLGAIVVDEEHEPSYKHGGTPRYHARDVARARGRLEGARVVLGSATPSLETLHLVNAGGARRFELPNRIGMRPLPPVEIVDLRSAERVPEARAFPWSTTLDTAVGDALGRGEQIILLLNRRGFATFLQCPSCGTVTSCRNCAIALTVHRTPAGLRCHYCGHEEPVPATCAACGHGVQRMAGVGTQQLEEFVAARFPAARLARMDLDTTSTKWAHQRILERVGRREVDILLGTQMIAKGLDFPDVTVVGVVDADTGLHLPDFRAAERTFHLVAQVAGRAGRGSRGGRVYVQTRAPDHHAIRAASRHSVAEFAAAELPLRSPPHPVYPPTVGLVRFVTAATDADRAERIAGRVAAWLRRANGERWEGALTVLGPAPCPLARLEGRWRWHVLAKAAEPRALGRVVRAWRRVGRGPVQVDRDPVALL